MTSKPYYLNDLKAGLFVGFVSINASLTYDLFGVNKAVVNFLHGHFTSIFLLPSIKNIQEFSAYPDGLSLALLFSFLITVIAGAVMVSCDRIKYRLPDPGTTKGMASAATRLRELSIIVPLLITYSLVIFIPLSSRSISWVHHLFRIDWSLIFFLSFLTLINLELLAYMIELIKARQEGANK